MRLRDRVFVEVLAAALPAVAAAVILLWAGDYDAKTRWTVALVIVAVWLAFALVVRERVTRSAQTAANLIAALREGDYSMRGRGAHSDDGYGLLIAEINALSDDLRARRLSDAEAGALLGKVLSETDLAIFAFDSERRLRVANRAAGVLLGETPERLIGRDAAWLGLGDLLDGDAPRTVAPGFARGGGPFELRRHPFRSGGRRHTLIVLADISRVLREEERQAWQRLVRVLSHEINNSLAPISSIVAGLRASLERGAGGGEWRGDAARGLEVIGRRAESLARFMTSYARLARLPPPDKTAVDFAALVRRVAGLPSDGDRPDIDVAGGPEVSITADPAQLEQLLINLIRNAVDAAAETGGGVSIAWSVGAGWLDVTIADDGPGLIETANLFVPFFTTKPGGSGIGLALSRQIADAHGGRLTLENRADRRGCEARLRLQLDRPDLGSAVPDSPTKRRPLTGFRTDAAGPAPAPAEPEP